MQREYSRYPDGGYSAPYLEVSYQRNQPTKAYQTDVRHGVESCSFAYEPVPAKPISAMNRPILSVPAKKNIDSFESQEQRDAADFNRRAHRYRRDADKPYHHNRPQESVQNLWEAGHIADRGRGRTADATDRGLYNPITSDYILPPAYPQEPRSPGAGDPGSNSRPASARPDKDMQKQLGTYNPITHTWLAPPDEEHVRRRTKEFERNLGLSARVRTETHGSFDPISGEWRPSTPGGLPPESVSNNDRRQRPGTADPLRDAYNPITHAWVAAVEGQGPDRSSMPYEREQNQSISGGQRRRVPLPANQGVYDPIKNTWIVPPMDARAVEGLSHKPATWFTHS